MSTEKTLLPARNDLHAKARRGEAVEVCGLTLYPILMCDYDSYCNCRDIITMRMNTLPVKYLSLDWFSAIVQMEFDEIAKSGKNVGMLFRALMMLYLSLRLDEDITFDMLEKSIRLKDANGKPVVDGIVIIQNGNTFTIKPNDFSKKIRPVIAELNGLEMPDETINPDIVRANEKLIEMQNGKLNLDTNTDSIITTVALLSHVSRAEIETWTVKEFELYTKAIGRLLHYIIYAQAELSGAVQFKKGNPFPHWGYDKKDDSFGMVSLAEIGKQLGGLHEGGAVPS